jgi:peptidoglycan/LPS O-acetylase OafA/YrhL
MSPVSPYAPVLVIVIALGVALLLAGRVGAPATAGRFVALDGLRGYLALFVFIFHAAIWYGFLKTKELTVPASHLYAHFGQDSVLLFFMITGFLFWSKLIDAKSRPIDWTKLYVSRAMRLVPLYLFAFLVMIATVAALTHFTVQESRLALLRHTFDWLTFSVFGQPEINNDEASKMMLGDNWTLPYEWFFYFSLPACALLFRFMPSIWYAALSVVALFLFGEWATNTHMLWGFVSGIFAAHAVRSKQLQLHASGWAASLVVLAAVIAAVRFFPSGYSRIVLVLLTVAFTIIASGNSLFGILTSRVSRTLGEMGYSIYLLHGALLFMTFRVAIGYSRAAALSSTQYWLIIAAVTSVLILLCSMTFRFIEKPGMDAAPAMYAWIKARVNALSALHTGGAHAHPP